MPILMDAYRNQYLGTGSSTVEDIDTFKAKFSEMTEHLEKMDWNGVFIAGGSVLASLLPKTKEIG
jgi:hypothetical protein